MRSLRDLQQSLGACLLASDAPVLDEAIAGEAAIRFGVYRNNVIVSLQKVLADDFPAILKLVGEEFFRMAARAFIRRSPPVSRVLAEYGAGFADFLDAFEPADGHPYLGDVARLERALDEALVAQEAAPLSPRALASLPAEAYAEMQLELHPTRRLLRSRYPVAKIRRLALGEIGENESVSLDEGPVRLLVIRPQTEVFIHDLSEADYAFVTAIDDGLPLSKAVDAGLEADPGFDTPRCLKRLLDARAFAGFTLKDSR